MSSKNKRAHNRRGLAAAMALIVLSAVGALAAAYSTRVVLLLKAIDNHRKACSARLAAESGIHYAMWALRDFRSEPTVGELPNLMSQIHQHLAAKIPAGATATYTAIDPNTPGSVEKTSVSSIALPDGGSFAFELRVTAWTAGETASPSQLALEVTGSDGGFQRKARLTFDVAVDKRLLHYAMASTLRVIARGNVQVRGPITSSWGRELRDDLRNHSTYPLDVALGPSGVIEGALGTTLSAEEFIGDPNLGDVDFHDGISSANPLCDPLDNMAYDEPEVMNLDSNDFDTSQLKLRTETDNLPSADDESYGLGVWGITGKRWKDHDGVSKDALTNIRVPKGTNPYFENCTFKGITYIEVDEQADDPTSGNQNSVIFKNCTFEGPIITGVPKKMDWRYNCMQFQGSTEFRTSMIQAALGGVTLMAPNYNVNIGGSEGGGGGYDSEVRGLVIGGCVDMYNKLHVKGTVISMARLIKDGELNVSPGGTDSWLAGSSVCGSNLGNLDGSSDEIVIEPDPDNVIPLGIKKRYIVTPRIDSYQEVFP